MDQSVFETIYRGRQTPLHHMAYMRMSKVLLALDVLDLAGVDLAGKKIFDYGFGAGTFFRYCPQNSALSGVEMDGHNVAEVSAMLRKKGFAELDLQSVDIATWEAHPLLSEQFDVIVCSHVLEHLEDPEGFLRVIKRCLAPGGYFLGLVPVNERADNPHHVQKPVEALVRKWSNEAGLAVSPYVEADEILYPFQPLFAHDTGWQHKLAQVASIGLGIPATFAGPKRWWRFSRFLGGVFAWKPCQAAFLLQTK